MGKEAVDASRAARRRTAVSIAKLDIAYSLDKRDGGGHLGRISTTVDWSPADRVALRAAPPVG